MSDGRGSTPIVTGRSTTRAAIINSNGHSNNMDPSAPLVVDNGTVVSIHHAIVCVDALAVTILQFVKAGYASYDFPEHDERMILKPREDFHPSRYINNTND
jgi:hypothetical protein